MTKFALLHAPGIAKQYAEGTNVVVLDPDVADVFKDRQLVNDTLRAVARIIDLQSPKRRSLTKRSSRPRPGSGSGEQAGTRRGRGG
jgi:hypothetical protein